MSPGIFAILRTGWGFYPDSLLKNKGEDDLPWSEVDHAIDLAMRNGAFGAADAEGRRHKIEHWFCRIKD